MESGKCGCDSDQRVLKAGGRGFRIIGFFKGFRIVKNHKEIAAELDLSAGQLPDPGGHF